MAARRSKRERQRAEQAAANFGRWLDVTLANSRTTGRQLAESIGVHDSAVSRWRSGTGVPALETCMKIAGAMGVDPLRLAVTAGHMDSAVVGIEPLDIPPPIAEREHVRSQIMKIKGLTEESRSKLLETYEATEGENHGGTE